MKALEKIVVRRPALPSRLLGETQGLPQEVAPTKLNPEFQEKQLAESELQKSENLHGGTELTFSMSSSQRSEHRQESGRDGQQYAATQQQSNADGFEEGDADHSDIPAELLRILHHSAAFSVLQMIKLKSARSRPRLKYLQTEFYRLIEMLAEEETRQFDQLLCSKARYNVKKMIMRRYEGKPPTRYKMPIHREGIILILDNSGSMFAWAEMLITIAELAAQRRDVEIYIAPNGRVEEQISMVKRSVSHSKFISKTAGRTIIYVGDFDGGDTPVELSWRNTVYWIAPEDRYRRFREHNWMHYDESRFKGFFIRVFGLEEMFDALRKAVAGVRWIDRCDVCESEREDYEEE
jgi:hypothetical protein